MEQILTLKVDLEHPDDARHAIDKAVEAYEQNKKHWEDFELNEAKSKARDILYNLCNDGYSMIWTVTDGAVGLTIWKSFNEPCVGQCYMPKENLYDIWSKSWLRCALPQVGKSRSSSQTRLVSAGDEFSQGAKPKTQTEAGNGCWRVPKRCQQVSLDGEVHQPVL